jgi:FMN-dependent oxidoreductase (nitrilotriacetate monooxygenase family)
MDTSSKMKIAVLCNTGPHGWLAEGAASEGDMSFDLYRHIARTSERGMLDILFLADGVGIKTLGLGQAQQEMMGNAVHFEPTTLLGALTQVTQHIGLVGTISTTYAHPYHIARQIGSLDFLSGGRAGWNVVTSGSVEEALNFGYSEQVAAETRYRRANEVVDAVFALWDSFDADAFPRDKASKRYFDHDKLHDVKHSGEFFKIKGPLNMPRPPQGRPIVSQAGTSKAGHAMAARTADVMYAKFSTLSGGRAFREQMNAALARHDRKPGDLAVLPGFFPIIGATEEEAKRKFMEIGQYLDDQAGLSLIKGFWNLDLSGYPLDEPLPDLPSISAFAHGEDVNLMRNGKRLTIRESFHWLASAYGHLSVIGTPEMVADSMELWFREGGADGFNLFLHSLPGSLDDFVNEVVPILQKRGLMNTEYPEGTLRQRMGLA